MRVDLFLLIIIDRYMSTNNKSMKSYLGVVWPQLVGWNWKNVKGLNSVFADLELAVVHLKKICKL